MTPLINMVVKRFSDIARNWDPSLSGWHDPEDLLKVLAEADVYAVDEAEFDTTLARLDQADHFDTGLSLALTAPAVWLEYKAYRSPIHPTEGRSAFLAKTLTTGDVRVMTVSWHEPTNLLGCIHMFDFPGEILGADVITRGREIILRNAFTLVDYELGNPGGGATAMSFFMEMLAFVHLPVGLVTEVRTPLPATIRRMRAELGPQITLKPWWALRYDRGQIEVAA